MLIVHRNCLIHNRLNTEDLAEVETPVRGHDEDRCWHEILEKDESPQHALGKAYLWEEILNRDYSERADAIVAPKALRGNIEAELSKLGFSRKQSYYSDEDHYYFEME